jgi:transposase
LSVAKTSREATASKAALDHIALLRMPLKLAGGEPSLGASRRSKQGTEVAALFYSLIESAKLCGVEPRRYLLTATRAALADRHAVMLAHTLIT